MKTDRVITNTNNNVQTPSKQLSQTDAKTDEVRKYIIDIADRLDQPQHSDQNSSLRSRFSSTATSLYNLVTWQPSPIKPGDQIRKIADHISLNPNDGSSLETRIANCRKELVDQLKVYDSKSLNEYLQPTKAPYSMQNLSTLVRLQRELDETCKEPEAPQKNYRLQSVSIGFLQQNEFDQALQVVDLITDEDVKDTLRLKFVNAFVETQSYEQALKNANLITGEIQKSSALKTIVDAHQKSENLDKALEIAILIPNEKIKFRAFATIMFPLITNGTLNEAIKVGLTSSDPIFNSKILAAIAIALSDENKPLEDVRKVIDAIPDEEIRLKTLEAISKPESKNQNCCPPACIIV